MEEPPQPAPVRRRRHVKVVAGAALVAVPLGLGLSALVRSPGGRGDVASMRVTTTSRPSTSPVAEVDPVPGKPLAGVEVVEGTTVLDLSRYPAAASATLPGVAQASPSPVRTPSGLVVSVGDQVDHLAVVLIPPTGGERILAPDAAGMAVNGTGERVAWAVSDPGGRAAEVVESAMDGRVLHTASLDRFARVVGYAGDVVVLETGDGAEAFAATWVPGSATVGRLIDVPGAGSLGSVVGTDPRRRTAVFGVGDGGGCATLADVHPDGTVGRLRPSTICEQRPSAGRFSPDGTRLAVPVGSSGAGKVEVVGADGQAVRTFRPRGIPTQVRWLDDDTVLILTLDSSHRLYRCSVTADMCEQHWTFAAPAVALVIA